MEQRTLFVLTDDNKACSYYKRKRPNLIEDFGFYFNKPRNFIEYDPTKMVYVFEPPLLNTLQKDDDLARRVDPWYPFVSHDIRSLITKAFEYGTCVVLLQKETSSGNIHSIQSLQEEGVEVFTAERFDPDFDGLEEILTFQEILETMKVMYNPSIQRISGEENKGRLGLF